MTGRANVAASVKQRLLNLAHQRGEEFNLVLVRYGIERLLYRLSRSGHGSEFVLKGAMLFHLWTAAPHRPTRDVYLLGRGTPDRARLEGVFRSVCTTAVDEDGLDFLPESVRAERIRDELASVVSELRAFLLPPLDALVAGRPFERTWTAGGPWRVRTKSGD